MAAQVNINKLIRETQQYEFADGLREIQLGVMFLGFGVEMALVFDPRWLAFLLHVRTSLGAWAVWVPSILVMLMPVLLTWVVLLLMNIVRRRWLWRDTGIVKPRRMIVPRWLNFLSAAVLLAGILLAAGLRVAGLIDEGLVWRLVWVSIGWSTACVMVGLGRHIGLARYVQLGGLGGALSTLVLFMPLDFMQAAGVLSLLWGGLLSTSGLLVLRRTWQAVRAGDSREL